jgi:IMP dehydrogenase/GMP reductase
METMIRTGLTYDDVLLEPRCSNIHSRRDVDTSAQLSRHVIASFVSAQGLKALSRLKPVPSE